MINQYGARAVIMPILPGTGLLISLTTPKRFSYGRFFVVEDFIAASLVLRVTTSCVGISRAGP